ncbi:condensin subunit [Pichia kluyveri]|uniref:Condensin subunit n=1 Tax=Pichia kluyveri TaxID=36015 RepID=A0AAV5R7W5_PICKL|nr:condensin subunit [Pichia kluyveri]
MGSKSKGKTTMANHMKVKKERNAFEEMRMEDEVENGEESAVDDSENDDDSEEEEDVEEDQEEDDDDEEEEEEDDDDDDIESGDIDEAIRKADEKKKPKSRKKQTQYLNVIGEINDMEDIKLAMRKVFNESQTTVASHKRQLVVLQAVMYKSYTLNLSFEFNRFFCFLLNKILPLKKNIKPADKVVKFISSFFDFVNPSSETFIKNNNNNNNKIPINIPMDKLEDIYSDFVERTLKYLMKGLVASNNTVRYRICQLLSHIISNCGGMDEDLYKSLSDELTTRIYDKDAPVRIKAISALACFQNDDGSSLSLAGKKIRFVMQNDPNSEVRRSCLKHIEKNKFTEPFIVERAHDIDNINRRLLFSKILPTYKHFNEINLNHREKLLQWGLRDRDESVRKACANWLTTTWMNDLNKNIAEFINSLNVIENDIAEIAVRTLLDKRPNIVKEAKFNKEFFNNLTPSSSLFVRIVFEYCQDNKLNNILENQFLEATEFASLFEHYFNLRTENLTKISNNRDKIMKNPEYANEIGIIDPDDYNYIVMQLLKIAIDYDYSDEFGRNKMYSILRTTLSNNTVTEPLLPLLMECLRKLAINERDFCQMTVEIINDLKDSDYERIMEIKRRQEQKEKEELRKISENKLRARDIESINDNDNDFENINEKVQNLLRDDGEISDSDSDSDDDFHSAAGDMSRQSMIEANKSRQEEIDQITVLSPEILTDCLTITKCMLQLVFSPLRENMLLISLLDNFIVPCVNQRSEVEVRKLALICHGLCGLLDKEVAVSTMVVAGIFVTRSDHESFVVVGLKVIGDLLTIHGLSILQSENQRSIDSMAVAKVFYRTLKDESKPEAQSVVAVTLFKLFLCGVITDHELFETTLLTFFNPKVNKNQALKQCLTFCIPTYAFSRAYHQELIASIANDTITRLFKDWDSITRYNEELELKKPITASFIIENFLYWTDPYNLAISDDEEMESSSVHLEFGIQLMKCLRNYDHHNKLHKTLYKPIIRSLTKLTFTSKADINKLRRFRECFDDEKLCQGDLNEVLNSDLICKNSFLKAHTYIDKCLKEAESMNELKKEENKDDKESPTEPIPEVNSPLNVTGNDNSFEEFSNPAAQSSMVEDIDASDDDGEDGENGENINEVDIISPDVKKEEEDSDNDSIELVNEVTVENPEIKVFSVKQEKVNDKSTTETETETETALTVLKRSKKNKVKSKKPKSRSSEIDSPDTTKSRVEKPRKKKSKSNDKDKENKRKVSVSQSVSIGDTSEIILLDSE